MLPQHYGRQWGSSKLKQVGKWTPHSGDQSADAKGLLMLRCSLNSRPCSMWKSPTREHSAPMSYRSTKSRMQTHKRR